MVTEAHRLQLLDRYRQKAHERVQQIRAEWQEVRSAPEDADRCRSLLRELHTLKGESKMMGFSDIGLVAQRGELLVTRASQDHFTRAAEVDELLAAATETIEALLAKRVGPDQPHLDLVALIERFDRSAQLSEYHRGAHSPVGKSMAAVASHLSEIRDEVAKLREIAQDEGLSEPWAAALTRIHQEALAALEQMPSTTTPKETAQAATSTAEPH